MTYRGYNGSRTYRVAHISCFHLPWKPHSPYRCERVTELEVVRAMRRSLPIDSSQAIRKRTRAGMGHCQGDALNYNCEGRVRAIIARELGNGARVDQVGGRPWPATSTLTQRWIDDDEKKLLEERMMVA